VAAVLFKRYSKFPDFTERFDTLHASAMYGLVIASQRWIPERGDFQAYGRRTAFNQIIDDLRDNRLIHIPPKMRLKKNKNHRFQKYVKQALSLLSASELVLNKIESRY